jgi:cytochrome c-type biogenesis protein
MTFNVTVPAITVFLQGVLSFFSPCVLPLLPIYMGYLSGGAVKESENGEKEYNRGKVLINTIFFVIGISFSFFLLGLGLRGIGVFFAKGKTLLTVGGGLLVIFFGIYQLFFYGRDTIMNSEKRLPVNLDKFRMSPWTAWVMGFVFSFAWTPCVGPVLSSVLLMASSEESFATSLLLIGVYTLGYILPFILVGVFTTELLRLFGRHKSVVKYTVKIGAILLIFMGILMISGKVNILAGNSGTASSGVATAIEKEDSTISKEEPVSEEASHAAEEEPEEEFMDAPDFSLVDQYGNTHTLADYKGKILFLNFWATWCPPCREELPYINELYNEFKDSEDVAILGVTFPNLGNEQDVAGVTGFLDDNGYDFPVMMDEGASLMQPYYITAFPTTYLISDEGKVLGYIPGGMDKETMLDVIRQAKELSED